MQKDERDALEVLKFELGFIEKGGYGRSPRNPWRAQFVFEDSPTCMNYDCRENPGPCSDCILMRWVPPERREENVPCRHIPLGPDGETLDSLYRYGDQCEIEEAVAGWLRATIEKLEDERKNVPPQDGKHPLLTGDALPGTPLYQQAHPKCANSACPTAFHWLAGGKFFRFRPTPRSASETLGPASAAAGGHERHDVKHFWLCERCSHVFTLVYSEEGGVILKLLWPELPLAKAHSELPAA